MYISQFKDLSIWTRPGIDKVKPQAGLFHHILNYMVDLHLVHPALNLSTLDAGILILMQQVSLMMFSLNMVDYPMSFLLLSGWIFLVDKYRGQF